jgi:hypothetical protein
MIAQLEKKAKKRWHPDRVAHLKDPTITEEYTINFQQVEGAYQMIYSYLNGTYQAGGAFSFTDKKQTVHEEPEKVIRNNVPNIQTSLRDLWTFIKEKKYKWSVKEVLLSDGFKLKDLLEEDFKEDLAMLSVISFFYGLIFLGIFTAIAASINPVFGTIVGIIWFLQALSCFLGFAPLSRFWLPRSVTDVALKFINFGLGIYNWAEEQVQSSDKGWLLLFIRLPVLFAKLVKYIVLFPITELVKIFVGDKIVGVVKQNVNYYAEAAEWYIEELLTKNPNEMSSEELFHISYLYSELKDVKSKY